MSLAPKIFAGRFQGLVKSALGGSDAMNRAMTHVGAQNLLRTGAGLKETRSVLTKLEREGRVADVGRAERAYKREARVAIGAARMRTSEFKQENLAQRMAEQAGLDSVVREQEHSVSVLGDKNVREHSVSVGQNATHRATVSTRSSTDAGAVVSGTSGAHATASVASQRIKKPFMDIPLD